MSQRKSDPYLPAEVIAKVFTQLDNKDLISSAQVNEEWYAGATRILWSRTPLDINSQSALKCLGDMPEFRRKVCASYVRELRFEAFEDVYFQSNQFQAHDEAKVSKFFRLMDDLKFPSVRSIRLKTIWNAHERWKCKKTLEDIQTIALSMICPQIEELYLEEGNHDVSFVVDWRKTAQLTLPPNNITKLTLTDQASYGLAIEILKSVPKLKEFTWKGSFHRQPINRDLWSLLDGLSEFSTLDVVTMLSINGRPKDGGSSKLIPAQNVNWSEINIDLLEAALDSLDKSVLRTLHVGTVWPSWGTPGLSTPLESLTRSRNNCSSNLVELSIQPHVGARYSGWGDPQYELTVISGATLVGLAESNPKLQVLSLGSYDCFIRMQRFDEAAMVRFARAVPDLRSFVAYVGTYNENDDSLPLISVIDLGRHCRRLSVLKVSDTWDITTSGFRRMVEDLPDDGFCLFPELDHVDVLCLEGIEDRPPPERLPPERYQATLQEKEAFFGFVAQHFPKLTTLSRTRLNGLVITCQLDGTDISPDSRPVERILHPYYQNDFLFYL